MARIFDSYSSGDISHRFPDKKPNKKKLPEYVTSAKLIYNLAHEFIGVEAKEDTVFSLFFTLINASRELLENGYFYLEIYDRYHNLIKDLDLDVCLVNKTVSTKIYADEAELPYGNYFINLKVDYNDICYVLISENDMFLSIK